MHYFDAGLCSPFQKMTDMTQTVVICMDEDLTA
jgi:hypothetical protein